MLNPIDNFYAILLFFSQPQQQMVQQPGQQPGLLSFNSGNQQTINVQQPPHNQVVNPTDSFLESLLLIDSTCF